MIEKAQLAQAVRLLDQDYDRITNKDIVTLKAEDIELPEIEKRKAAAHRFCLFVTDVSSSIFKEQDPPR